LCKSNKISSVRKQNLSNDLHNLSIGVVSNSNIVREQRRTLLEEGGVRAIEDLKGE
jgi:hypothetical protein